MKKFIFLILALWSLIAFGMEVGEEESAVQDVCHIDLIPDEVLVMILEQLSSECFTLEVERKHDHNICHEYRDYINCPTHIHEIKTFNHVLNLLKNMKLVCIRFNRCADNLIQSSALAHFHNKRTPLLLALSKRDYNLAKYLLNHGANPNLSDYVGGSPLIIAIEYCEDFRTLYQSGLLDLMLEQGADVNAKDIHGHNALSTVTIKNFRGKEGNGINKYKAFQREIELYIDLLIKYGVKLNDKLGYAGKTALGWAVEWENLYIVKVLLGRGAHIYHKDSTGEPIIEHARKKAWKKPWNKFSLSILEEIEAKEKENLDLGGAQFCTIS